MGDDLVRIRVRNGFFRTLFLILVFYRALLNRLGNGFILMKKILFFLIGQRGFNGFQALFGLLDTVLEEGDISVCILVKGNNQLFDFAVNVGIEFFLIESHSKISDDPDMHQDLYRDDPEENHSVMSIKRPL